MASEAARNNSKGPRLVGPTQFLIHEEGGLERWFNLTITNVGLESVADYTCVAVNAGGVMEEAITLTFEEPEPVRIWAKFRSKDTVVKIKSRIVPLLSRQFLMSLKLVSEASSFS